MTKRNVIEKIEQMIQDRNYYINSKKGTEIQKYAWEYDRETLQIVLKIVKAIEEDNNV